MIINSTAKHQPGAWGDFIGKLWACEYIKTHKPEWEILFDDSLKNGHMSEYIKIPWSTQTDIFTGSHQVITHHRHWWVHPAMNDYPNFDYGKPIFFDLHGMSIKMIAENWFPTFIPTDKVLEEFESLNLPEVYNAVHLNFPDARWKRIKYTEDLSIPKDEYWITTNESIDGLPNFKDINPWTKLYVLIKADKVQCCHSGFTAIAASYRKRKNITLIGYWYPHTLYLGPPCVSYSNVSFETKNYRKLYYHADNSDVFSDYFKYIDSRKNDWINTSQYEDCNGFDKWNIDVPEEYDYERVSLTRENCLVPVDTTYKIDDHSPAKLTPNNDIIWGGVIGGTPMGAKV